MMRNIILCCALVATLAAGAYAINCYQCQPTNRNNYCQDYNNQGFPSQATQQPCSGFCFKADGNLKVTGANDQRFVVSDCLMQTTADQLGIGGSDYCKSGDDAKRYFRSVITPQAVEVKTEQISPTTVVVSSYVLPGSIDYVRYCKCDRDLCNSAAGVSITSISMILAVVTAFAVKMLH